MVFYNLYLNVILFTIKLQAVSLNLILSNFYLIVTYHVGQKMHEIYYKKLIE